MSCSMLQNRDRVKRTFSVVLLISQEDGKRVEIQVFERELCATEEGSIKEENLLEGKPFLFKIRDIVTNVWR